MSTTNTSDPFLLFESYKTMFDLKKIYNEKVVPSGGATYQKNNAILKIDTIIQNMESKVQDTLNQMAERKGGKSYKNIIKKKKGTKRNRK